MTWVEHTRCRRCTVAPLYRAVTASGVAFGARRWVAALQLQCERMVFAVATNVPTRDSTGKTITDTSHAAPRDPSSSMAVSRISPVHRGLHARGQEERSENGAPDDVEPLPHHRWIA